MRLVQLTDTHIYADAAARFDGVDTRASFARVLDAATRVDGRDRLVITGDVSMDGSTASYAWLADRLAALPDRVILLPGNHDEPGAWPPDARGAPGFGALPATIAGGGWRVHLLDTRIAGAPHGRVGAAVRAWLAQALAQAPDAHHAVLMHHPPLPMGSPWIDAMGLEDAAAFLALLAASPALRLVACGHVHQNHDVWLGTTRVLTTPSTCVQFAPSSRDYAVDARAPGFRILDLHPHGGIATQVVRVPPR